MQDIQLTVLKGTTQWYSVYPCFMISVYCPTVSSTPKETPYTFNSYFPSPASLTSSNHPFAFWVCGFAYAGLFMKVGGCANTWLMGPASVTLHQSFGTHPHSSVGQHSFLLISESYSTVWMSIQDRYLGSFHIWATMNFSGINEQVFIFIPLIWNLLPSDVIIGSYSNSVSRFLTSKWFSIEAVPFSIPPSNM